MKMTEMELPQYSVINGVVGKLKGIHTSFPKERRVRYENPFVFESLFCSFDEWIEGTQTPEEKYVVEHKRLMAT